MNDDIIEYTLDSFAGMNNRTPPKPREIKGVVEYTEEGDYVTSYDSVAAAHLATGISIHAIQSVCSGRALISTKCFPKKIFLYRGDDIAERLKAIEKREKLHPKSDNYKQVCEYTLGGRLLFKYPTVNMAAKVNNVTPMLMTYCCKGRRLYLGNKVFMYANGNIKQRVREVKKELYRLSKKRPKYKPVDVYTLEGEFIKGFPSASAASRELDTPVSAITRCCNGTTGYGHNCFTSKGRIFLWCGDCIANRLQEIEECKLNKKK